MTRFPGSASCVFLFGNLAWIMFVSIFCCKYKPEQEPLRLMITAVGGFIAGLCYLILGFLMRRPMPSFDIFCSVDDDATGDDQNYELVDQPDNECARRQGQIARVYLWCTLIWMVASIQLLVFACTVKNKYRLERNDKEQQDEESCQVSQMEVGQQQQPRQPDPPSVAGQLAYLPNGQLVMVVPTTTSAQYQHVAAQAPPVVVLVNGNVPESQANTTGSTAASEDDTRARETRSLSQTSASKTPSQLVTASLQQAATRTSTRILKSATKGVQKDLVKVMAKRGSSTKDLRKALTTPSQPPFLEDGSPTQNVTKRFSQTSLTASFSSSSSSSSKRCTRSYSNKTEDLMVNHLRHVGTSAGVCHKDEKKKSKLSKKTSRKNSESYFSMGDGMPSNELIHTKKRTGKYREFGNEVKPETKYEECKYRTSSVE